MLKIAAASAPPGCETRIVAIDGPGGAGKSSLALALAEPLGAQVVQTDDFASWENPLDWWPELIERVFEPLREGKLASYRPTSWGGGERAPVVVEPGGIVLVEGVSASRRAFRPYLAFSIWVETDREVRLARGLERDGLDARGLWERWMAGEDQYVASERPAEHVDVVLPGDRGLWS